MELTASQPRVLRQLLNRLKPGRVEVTGGFLLLTAWLNYLDAQGVVPLALLSCALHEMGHLLAIRMLGGRVRRISITAVGAEMELDRALSYGNECLAALAGPLVNLIMALLFCRIPGGTLFSGLNLVLACFNLLPIGRLDGGRVLCCALCWLLGPGPAWSAAQWINRLCISVLLLFGVCLARLGNSVTLLLTALWLAYSWLGALPFSHPSIRNTRRPRAPRRTTGPQAPRP